MWFKHKPTVTCFYCNTTLPLLPLDPKGKLPQVESRVARGIDRQFECGVCGCINERDKVCLLTAQGVPELAADEFISERSNRLESSSSLRFSSERGIVLAPR